MVDIDSIEIFSEESLQLGLKIQAAVTYSLNVCFGLPLAIGIALFEKNAGDPQKRLLDNQVICFMILSSTAAIISNGCIVTLRVFYGPVGNPLAIFFLLNREFLGVSCQLGLTQIMIFRWLSVFNWRLAAQINDNFMSAFLNCFNIMLGLCLSGVTFTLGMYQSEKYFVMAGSPEAAFHSPSR